MCKSPQFSYSALLAVCYTDEPEWLSVALDSLLCQTVKPSEIVLVQNGPLTDELTATIGRYKAGESELFKILLLPHKMGLGVVIKQGIHACSNGFVACADADGYSVPTRIEEEFEALFANKADIVGTNINEFTETVENIAGRRSFPETSDEIYKFAKRRVPMALSSALFKKRMVLACCDYEDCGLVEDYALIIDLLSFCAKGYNVQKPLVFKRLHQRNGKTCSGWEYAKAMRYFNVKFFKKGWFRYRDYFFRSTVNEVAFMMPRFVKNFVYDKVLR